jgi:hypothetical protein
MKSQPIDRTGVLILRLWIEASHETGLRARITQTIGKSAGEQSVAVVSTADDICAVVKRWVDDFSDPASRDSEGEGDG